MSKPDAQPLSHREKTTHICHITEMLRNHPDLSDNETKAIDMLFSDIRTKNNLGISPRLPGEGRIAHLVRTFGDNRALKKVALKTATQVIKSVDLVYDWKKLNSNDNLNRVLRLAGGYLEWAAMIVKAAHPSIGHEECEHFLKNQANKN